MHLSDTELLRHLPDNVILSRVETINSEENGSSYSNEHTEKSENSRLGFNESVNEQDCIL